MILHLEVIDEVIDETIISVSLTHTGAPYYRRSYSVEAVRVETGRVVSATSAVNPVVAAQAVFEAGGQRVDLLALERASLASERGRA